MYDEVVILGSVIWAVAATVAWWLTLLDRNYWRQEAVDSHKETVSWEQRLTEIERDGK